jgi:hypothetical protein
MPTVSVSGPEQAAVGTQVDLQAAASEPGASAYRWKKDGQDLPAATASTYSFTMTADSAGSYTASVEINGVRTAESAPHELRLPKAADPGTVPTPPAPGDTAKAEAPPTWGWGAALVFGAVVLAAGLLILSQTHVLSGRAGLGESEWDSLDGRAKVAVTLAVPMLVLGGFAVLVGIWMAAVEWKGRFRRREDTDAVTVKGPSGQDVAAVIDSIGKLRGAAIVLVVGAALMFAAAWVASSAAETPQPSPTASPTSPPPP